MRNWTSSAMAVGLGAVFVALLLVPGIDEPARLVISNTGQLAAAVLASAGCAVAARRLHGHRRAAWCWLAVGAGCWATGQAVWSYYELVLGMSAPFPSPADVGFLLFPVAATIGLTVLLGAQSGQLVARGRDLFDGAVIAGSLVLLSWVTTLGAVAGAHDSTTTELALSLAYPVGDLIVATLVLMALARTSRTERRTLVVLALGLGGLAFSDSAYVYVTTVSDFDSLSPITAGWIAGFLLMGASGVSVTGERNSGQLPAEPPASSAPSLLRIALPYVPVVLAGVTVLHHLVVTDAAGTVDLVLTALVVALVLSRQFLAMIDNQRLLLALAETRDELAHQALHDHLTGLPNRVLFADRLDHALTRPDAVLTVMYCDLDDFKAINDEHGHAVGDAYLREVARRLCACVRPTDTVARLGGDEFAVLLESDRDVAGIVAQRIVTSVRGIVEIEGHAVTASISVGSHDHTGPHLAATGPARTGDGSDRRRTTGTVLDTAAREVAASRMLQAADAAMYAAKSARKSARRRSAAQPLPG